MDDEVGDESVNTLNGNMYAMDTKNIVIVKPCKTYYFHCLLDYSTVSPLPKLSI